MNFIIEEIKINPNKLLSGKKSRAYLQEKEKEIKPDFVISVFGPSYWRPISPHIQGYAFGHYIYSDSPFYKNNFISLKEKLKWKIKKILHTYFIKRDGDYFICETQDVSRRVIDLFQVESKNVFTVSNIYNEVFDRFIPQQNKLLEKKNNNEFRILCLCSGDSHKNLKVLNDVIPVLEKKFVDFEFKFVLTIDKTIFETIFESDVKSKLINLGRVNIDDCPQLYFETDCLFLPSLIECFSANYPEAMKMNRPIVTSNLSFARDICGEAAYYINPLNPDDIANGLFEVLTNENIKKNLILKGNIQLKNFGTALERAQKYIEIGCKVSKRSNNYD